MTKEEFKTKAEELIEQLESLIEQMPTKVDTSESQKVLLQNQLNQFSYAVNGLEDSDLDPKDWIELHHNHLGLPVLFLKEDDNIFALFPTMGYGIVNSHKPIYSQKDQHSYCDIDYAKKMAATHGLPTEEEYKSLLNELERREYVDMYILNECEKFDIPLNMAGDSDPLSFLDSTRLDEDEVIYKFEFVGTKYKLFKC
jgi:hypothetical protein